jgi:hypothetical protein
MAEKEARTSRTVLSPAGSTSREEKKSQSVAQRAPELWVPAPGSGPTATVVHAAADKRAVPLVELAVVHELILLRPSPWKNQDIPARHHAVSDAEERASCRHTYAGTGAADVEPCSLPPGPGLGLAMKLQTAVLLAALAAPALADFNPLHHLGGQAPYFSAPSQFGLSADTPAGCAVDQAAYIVRHGSRYPSTGAYSGWKGLGARLAAKNYTASGPLQFLPSWTPPVDDGANEVEQLSGTGALEAFQLGVQLRRLGLTPGGQNFTVWSASQQRVVDTAQWFMDGYLAQGHYNISALGRIVKMADSVNYTCARCCSTRKFSSHISQVRQLSYCDQRLPEVPGQR